MVPWVGAWHLGSTVAAAGWNSSGQVYWGHLRPQRRASPQRMRGAERSLVTVGRSFTVAKGFVPLWVIGWGEGC